MPKRVVDPGSGMMEQLGQEPPAPCAPPKMVAVGRLRNYIRTSGHALEVARVEQALEAAMVA